MNKNYILNEIKKANKLSIKIFKNLYKIKNKELSKIIYQLTEINEILSNLEIELEDKTNE